MKTYNVLSDSTFPQYTHTRRMAHAVSSHTHLLFLHTAAYMMGITRKMCVIVSSLFDSCHSARWAISPGVRRRVRKTPHTRSVSPVSHNSVCLTVLLCWLREAKRWKSKWESDVRTNEGKSQQGWEAGAGMKGTADRDRCTWSQNQPKLLLKKKGGEQGKQCTATRLANL